MLRNIATIVIVALLALIQVSASPVPGGDHKPDKYRTGKHQCKGGQIFNKELHKCLCLDRFVWDDYKCECICPEWLVEQNGKCVPCCPEGKIWDEVTKKCICTNPGTSTSPDLPMTLPAPGVPIKGPSPQSPNTTTVPVNKDGDEDGSMEDENDPGVILVGEYVERLAAQTAPIPLEFTDDEGRIYSVQDAVDILDDYYCTDNVTGDPYVDFNCTAYFDAQYQHGGTNLTRRDLGFGTNAVSVPQIYRWRRGSVVTISVARNNKGVYMDLNAGITFAPPYWVTVRSSQISASAISKAIKYWNAAQIGVQFQFSTDLTKSTYVTKTGGTKGIALATAEYPAQEGGHQHLINVWDSSLELKWQPVGPNIISHELGHALGLAHNDQTTGIYQIWDGTGDSIMGSTVDSASNIITAIPDRDATGAYLLYNQLNPPTTNSETIVILTAPQGPVYQPSRPATPRCRWSAFGGCIYY